MIPYKPLYETYGEEPPQRTPANAVNTSRFVPPTPDKIPTRASPAQAAPNSMEAYLDDVGRRAGPAPLQTPRTQLPQSGYPIEAPPPRAPREPLAPRATDAYQQSPRPAIDEFLGRAGLGSTDPGRGVDFPGARPQGDTMRDLAGRGVAFTDRAGSFLDEMRSRADAGGSPTARGTRGTPQPTGLNEGVEDFLNSAVSGVRSIPGRIGSREVGPDTNFPYSPQQPRGEALRDFAGRIGLGSNEAGPEVDFPGTRPGQFMEEAAPYASAAADRISEFGSALGGNLSRGLDSMQTPSLQGRPGIDGRVGDWLSRTFANEPQIPAEAVVAAPTVRGNPRDTELTRAGYAPGMDGRVAAFADRLGSGISDFAGRAGEFMGNAATGIGEFAGNAATGIGDFLERADRAAYERMSTLVPDRPAAPSTQPSQIAEIVDPANGTTVQYLAATPENVAAAQAAQPAAAAMPAAGPDVIRGTTVTPGLFPVQDRGFINRPEAIAQAGVYGGYDFRNLDQNKRMAVAEMLFAKEQAGREFRAAQMSKPMVGQTLPEVRMAAAQNDIDSYNALINEVLDPTAKQAADANRVRGMIEFAGRYGAGPAAIAYGEDFDPTTMGPDAMDGSYAREREAAERERGRSAREQDVSDFNAIEQSLPRIAAQSGLRGISALDQDRVLQHLEDNNNVPATDVDIQRYLALSGLLGDSQQFRFALDPRRITQLWDEDARLDKLDKPINLDQVKVRDPKGLAEWWKARMTQGGIVGSAVRKPTVLEVPGYEKPFFVSDPTPEQQQLIDMLKVRQARGDR
jgi:hypothetical protein